MGGVAAGLRGAAAVLVRRRPRAEAGLGGALREGLGRRTGEEGKEELVGGGGGRGRGGGGVRLRELRAQLRRRGVDGRRGRVLACAVVRRVQARRCPVIHEESFPFIVALWGLATDYLLRLVICYILCRIDL